VWAVGYTGSFGQGDPQRLALEHWNGTTWTYVAGSASQEGLDNALYGIATTSGGHGWAVGHYAGRGVILEACGI
jgi:hypothetical protein